MAETETMKLTESIVEDAATEWPATLGYAVPYSREIAPGETYARRKACWPAVLDGRLGEALRGARPGAARRGARRRLARAEVGMKPGLVRT